MAVVTRNVGGSGDTSSCIVMSSDAEGTAAVADTPLTGEGADEAVVAAVSAAVAAAEVLAARAAAAAAFVLVLPPFFFLLVVVATGVTIVGVSAGWGDLEGAGDDEGEGAPAVPVGEAPGAGEPARSDSVVSTPLLLGDSFLTGEEVGELLAVPAAAAGSNLTVTDATPVSLLTTAAAVVVAPVLSVVVATTVCDVGSTSELRCPPPQMHL